MRREFLILSLSLAACHNTHKPVVNSARHLALVSRPGNAIYVDRADNRMVMQTDSAVQKNFCSFLIGLTDSSAGKNNQGSTERERYIQYELQKDWKALANGDTLQAVFFQEKPGLDQQVKEGVMVFETPGGIQPDTLIYRDSYGNWGTQILSLKENK